MKLASGCLDYSNLCPDIWKWADLPVPSGQASAALTFCWRTRLIGLASTHLGFAVTSPSFALQSWLHCGLAFFYTSHCVLDAFFFLDRFRNRRRQALAIAVE